MHPQSSTPDSPEAQAKKPPSGAARRRARAALGLPPYSEKDRAAKRRYDSKRAARKSKRRYDNRAINHRAFKLERGCADCGYREHAAALHFDHLIPAEKSGAVSGMVRRSSKRLLRAEMDKCDVVCANCHAIRTFNRRQQ